MRGPSRCSLLCLAARDLEHLGRNFATSFHPINPWHSRGDAVKMTAATVLIHTRVRADGMCGGGAFALLPKPSALTAILASSRR